MPQLKHILASLFLISLAFNGTAKEIEEENYFSEDDNDYICGEILRVKKEIDNAYCNSSNSIAVKNECEYIDKLQHSCAGKWNNSAVAIIDLSYNTEGVEPLNQRDSLEPEVSANTITHQYQGSTKGADRETSNLLRSENSTPPLRAVLKCINSIDNVWHCGFEANTYQSVKLSKTNQEKKRSLNKELFDIASAAISKL